MDATRQKLDAKNVKLTYRFQHGTTHFLYGLLSVCILCDNIARHLSFYSTDTHTKTFGLSVCGRWGAPPCTDKLSLFMDYRIL